LTLTLACKQGLSGRDRYIRNQVSTHDTVSRRRRRDQYLSLAVTKFTVVFHLQNN